MTVVELLRRVTPDIGSFSTLTVSSRLTPIADADALTTCMQHAGRAHVGARLKWEVSDESGIH